MAKIPAYDNIRNSIPSVNFHFWNSCNMRCRFCFARFNDKHPYTKKKENLNERECIEIIRQARNAGIKKMTFVGGEPLLCPWLPELLRLTKALGIKTMIVSNGALLDSSWFQRNGKYVDWFTLSVDSLCPQTNLATGRAIGGIKPLSQSRYYGLSDLIKSYGIKLKINTTVTQYNWKESLCDFISAIKPVRWKIFQVLRIIGQNESNFNQVRISSKKFNAFVKRHIQLKSECEIIIENNNAMTGSYLMIDSVGRFFDNELGHYRYSEPIYQVGWENALMQVVIRSDKFYARDGLYDW